MKSLKQVRRVGEVALVLLGLVTIPFLPRRVVLGLAALLGNIGRRCSPELMRIARANLKLAYGTSLTEAEIVAILRQACRHFVLVLLDLYWFALFSQRRIARYVAFDESVRHYDATRPAIMVTAHLGNWEVAGQALSLRGDPLVSVAAKSKNAVADFFLGWARVRTGQQLTRQAGAIRSLLRTLRAGGRVGLLLDQNTLPRDGGVFVTLFGLEVPASKAAAMLARHSGAGVVVTYCLTRPDGGYRVHCLPPYLLAGATDIEGTQAILLRLEAVIRENPGHWNWMYKRWKYVPVDRTLEQYPFYAKSVREVEPDL